MNQLFGPVSKSYCDWFYYLSIVGFVYFVASVILFILLLMYNKKKGSKVYINMLMVVLGYFLFFYFQNRLLYSMCKNTTY